MTKINLGCGPSGIDGWVNFDFGLLPLLGKMKLTGMVTFWGLLDKGYGTKWPKFVYRNIKRRLPFKNDSVDFIYCSHVLEHFERYEAVKILTECRRVLGRKGLIRIVLPDLKKMIGSYRDSDTFNREYWGYDKDKYTGILAKTKQKYIRPHRWMYDEAGAVSLLKEAGFDNIVARRFKEGRCPDIKKLDLVEHEPISLYLEAGGS